MRFDDIDYYSAAVCRRGHVETSAVELREQQIKRRCSECGSVILTACPACKYPIEGSMTGIISASYEPPQFCTHCGTPMPWSSRQARLYQLENILDEQEELSEADRLTIREQIQELGKQNLSEVEQTKHWQLIKKLSPTLIDVGKEIVVSITSEVIQKQLGIK